MLQNRAEAQAEVSSVGTDLSNEAGTGRDTQTDAVCKPNPAELSSGAAGTHGGSWERVTWFKSCYVSLSQLLCTQQCAGESGGLRVPIQQSGSQLKEVDQDHSQLTWPCTCLLSHTVGGDDTGSRVPCVRLSLLSGSWDEEKLENETTTKVLTGPSLLSCVG